MAARVLLFQRAAPWTATLLAGGIALYPGVVHAEAPPATHLSKKPIYDDLDALPPSLTTKSSPAAAPAAVPPTTNATTATTTTSTNTIETPSTPSPPAAASAVQRHGPTPTQRLAGQVRLARLFLYRQACAAEDGVNAALQRAFALESSVTGTVASLAPPRESGERVLPGLVYALVAAMAGSVVARRSNALVRLAAPPALGVAAACALLPVTMGNVGRLAWSWEQRVPAVARAHVRAHEGVRDSVVYARARAAVARRTIEEKVGMARETVEGWVRKGN